MTPASNSRAFTSLDVKSAFTALSTSNTATTSPWLFRMGPTTSLRLAELHATCPGKDSTSGTTVLRFPPRHTPLSSKQPRIHRSEWPKPSCLGPRRREKPTQCQPATAGTTRHRQVATPTFLLPTVQTTWAPAPQGETVASSSMEDSPDQKYVSTSVQPYLRNLPSRATHPKHMVASCCWAIWRCGTCAWSARRPPKQRLGRRRLRPLARPRTFLPAHPIVPLSWLQSMRIGAESASTSWTTCPDSTLWKAQHTTLPKD